MARIAGVNIPDNKRFIISLTYIYGIGRYRSLKICNDLNIDSLTRTKDLSEDMLSKVRDYIAKMDIVLEGDLRRQKSSDIKRLIDISCYKGIRHVKRLPVRGQRTKTNARTRKGKSSPIANKKKAVK